MGYKVAVIGATGVVGRELLRVLAERHFPADAVAALASGRAVGQQVSFGEREVLKAQSLERFDFAGWDLALCGAGAAVAATQVPRAAAAGCLVVDTSSRFRMEPDVPLVVPEVNGATLAAHRGLIANPNCMTAILTVMLAPLHRTHGPRRLSVATYRAASGAGAAAMRE